MERPTEPEPFPQHDPGSWNPVESRVVQSWPVGHFVENLAVDPAGDVYVTLHTHGRIERYRPTDGTATTFVKLPAPPCGVAFDPDGGGNLWVTGGTVGQAPGYVWRVSSTGDLQEWVQIPDAVFMNGCAPHPDGHTLLVCESVTGRIIAVDLRKPEWTVWIADDILSPVTPDIPGANGIKVRDGQVWISVTDRNLLLRSRIQPDGTAGPLNVALTHLRADDFAFSTDGALYIATHPANSVLRLGTDGSRATIAGPRAGAVGSTACAFGRAPGDETALYVTTSGGLLAPFHGEVEDAKLLRMETGETGHPIAAHVPHVG
jgi:sugar lactone lactonase YvrE